ncbi:copper homeostasis protein CutC [Alkalibacterium olivapovliticus]|uniref:PF03932 family protein CutC n=1 Tax=Alkalibacterium olivapovliticus TaxID=99907 RepID=A0A2T0W8I7_9LACT|nr:copper homeostasis protein CutC [Alkalibacterium olivapovliticus]PRY83003.1 copper homeostasis protein [Alkalibacterium olivapovliticus]
MIKEFCAENSSGIKEAIDAGISRIECCDRLDVGGTTPTMDVQQTVYQYAHAHSVEVVTMIRPRGGDFVYSDYEKEMMRSEARQAVELGADGIVFGALTRDHQVDWAFVDELIDIAGESQTVFHMAFDSLSKQDQLGTIKELIDRQVTRLLTRGAESGSAIDNADWINQLIEVSDGRLEILVGGGITHENLDKASDTIHANQFHGTRIVRY